MSKSFLSMWDALSGSANSAATQADPKRRRELAAAVLMVEVARADFEQDDTEMAVVQRELARQFGLSAAEIAALTDEAQQTADDEVSLHRYVETLNDELGYDDKIAVLEMLWRVAYADGVLEKHEEHLMRRYADLLYIPHRDWIQAKLRVAKG